MIDAQSFISAYLNAPDQEPQSYQNLLQELLALEEKLANPDKQSFYFRLALANHEARLKSLKKQYEDFWEFVKEHDMDELLGEYRELVTTFEKISGGLRGGIIREYSMVSLANTIKKIEGYLL